MYIVVVPLGEHNSCTKILDRICGQLQHQLPTTWLKERYCIVTWIKYLSIKRCNYPLLVRVAFQYPSWFLIVHTCLCPDCNFHTPNTKSTITQQALTKPPTRHHQTIAKHMVSTLCCISGHSGTFRGFRGRPWHARRRERCDYALCGQNVAWSQSTQPHVK
jgi:hypothetical protein